MPSFTTLSPPTRRYAEIVPKDTISAQKVHLSYKITGGISRLPVPQDRRRTHPRSREMPAKAPATTGTHSARTISGPPIINAQATKTRLPTPVKTTTSPKTPPMKPAEIKLSSTKTNIPHPTDKTPTNIPRVLHSSIVEDSKSKERAVNTTINAIHNPQPPTTQTTGTIEVAKRPVRAMFSYENEELKKKELKKKDKIEELVGRMIKRLGETALEAILYDQGENIEGLCNGNYHQGEKWRRIAEIFRKQGLVMMEVALAGGCIEFLLHELPLTTTPSCTQITKPEVAYNTTGNALAEPESTKPNPRIGSIVAEAKKLASKGLKVPVHNDLSTRRISWGPVIIHGVAVEMGLLEKETHATVKEATDYLQGERERWCMGLLSKPTGKAGLDQRYAYQAKAIRCRMHLRGRGVDLTKPGHGVKDSQNPEVLARMPSGMSKRYLGRRKCVGVGSPLRDSISTTEGLAGAEALLSEDVARGAIPGTNGNHQPESNFPQLEATQCDITTQAVPEGFRVLRKVQSLRTLFQKHLPIALLSEEHVVRGEKITHGSLRQDLQSKDGVHELKAAGSSTTATRLRRYGAHISKPPVVATARKEVHGPDTGIRKPTTMYKKGQQGTILPNAAPKPSLMKAPPAVNARVDPIRTVTTKLAGRGNLGVVSRRPAPVRAEKPKFERRVIW